MKSSLRCSLIFVYLFSFSFLGAISDCNELMCDKDNPFLKDDMFDNLDFSKIELSHYLPALDKGIEEANAVITKIITNKEEPTFENVILPLEYDFRILARVSSVFFNLSSSLSDKLTPIESEFKTKLSNFYNELSFNKELFKKIEQIYNKKESLSSDERRVVELRYKEYLSDGINLSEDKQNRIKDINANLSDLSTQFKNNILADTLEKAIFFEDDSQLSGLSQSIINSFKVTKDNPPFNKDGYLITASKTDTLQILSGANNRELRKKAMDMYTSLGKEKNLPVIQKIINSKIELATIMEKPNYASYILENYSMAKTPEVTLDFMQQVWDKALAKAKQERDELQEFARQELNDPNFKLQAWDWFYWSEKLKAKIAQLDQNELKQYFELSNAREGVFTVISKLYDLEFIKIDKSVYHPDVEVFRVQNINTKEFVGELYLDYFARKGKNPGAWSSRIRSQTLDRTGNNNITPIVTCVFNFLKPASAEPALLSLDNVNTLFHEMGHAVHSLLANNRFPSLSSGYPRDFVELPSQILEKWAFHKDVLPLYAINYKTKQPISNDLVNKLKELDSYGKGFEKTEYLAAAIVDMKLHMVTQPFTEVSQLEEFENQVLSDPKYDLIPEIVVRYKLPYFKHIFAGGYDARYDAYLWSEVLVSDAFSFFDKKDVFSREVADSFKNNVLSRGNSEDPSILYERFSGNKNPPIDALMKDLGFTE